LHFTGIDRCISHPKQLVFDFCNQSEGNTRRVLISISSGNLLAIDWLLQVVEGLGFFLFRSFS